MSKHLAPFLHGCFSRFYGVFWTTIFVGFSLAPLDDLPALAAKSAVRDTLSPVSHGSILNQYSEDLSDHVGTVPSPVPSPVGGKRVIPLPAVLYQLPLNVPNLRQRPSEGLDSASQKIQQDHEDVRQTLLRVAEEFGKDSQNVPYVWGGNKIGDSEACEACRSCIAKKTRLKVEKRSLACKPCRQCGIDCSHFVHRVFKDAGLDFPYVTTRTLQRVSPLVLREEFRLVDVGRDLSKVRPGDLLLKKKHIVVLMRVGQEGRGDVLHVSRSTKKMGPGGGIEIAKDVDLRDFAGKLVKILRHVDTLNAPESTPQKAPLTVPDMSPVPTMRHPLLWSRTELIVRLYPEQGARSRRETAF